ncbi:MAG: hypothetical protein V1746_01205 [bacterium]
MSVAEIKESIHSMTSAEQAALIKDIVREMPEEERKHFLEDFEDLMDSIIIEETVKENDFVPYGEYRKKRFSA